MRLRVQLVQRISEGKNRKELVAIVEYVEFKWWVLKINNQPPSGDEDRKREKKKNGSYVIPLNMVRVTFLLQNCINRINVFVTKNSSVQKAINLTSTKIVFRAIPIGSWQFVSGFLVNFFCVCAVVTKFYTTERNSDCSFPPKIGLKVSFFSPEVTIAQDKSRKEKKKITEAVASPEATL